MPMHAGSNLGVVWCSLIKTDVDGDGTLCINEFSAFLVELKKAVSSSTWQDNAPAAAE